MLSASAETLVLIDPDAPAGGRGLFTFTQFFPETIATVKALPWSYGQKCKVRSNTASIPTQSPGGNALKDKTAANGTKKVTRPELIELLNEDLSREYQAIIGYVVYSQVLKGAEFMNIAGELEIHAAQELSHALIIAKQIDYLGGMPTVEAQAVRTSEKATEMLHFDLDNETETIRNYRKRVRQCEDLGEYAMGEQIRGILIEEQDHQIALATALGKSVPLPHKAS
jgi:bacterioferritin